jgi:hypothetical protein
MTGEQRAHSRQEAALTSGLLRVFSPEGEDLGLAVPDDVSTGGASLLAPRPCPPGALLALVPQAGHPLFGRRLAFRATRCEPLGGIIYRLSGAFDPQLGEADVLALARGVRRPPRGGRDERRRAGQ